MSIEAIKILSSGVKNTYYSFRLIPSDAILFLTYRCTSKCKMCNIWKRPNDTEKELTWKEWQPIFEKMASSGIKSIEMFGGDALLRKKLLLDMLSFCKENNMETYFPTNSNLLDEKTIKELLDAGLSTIYFSLDELPDMGGAIRGVSDHFNKVKNAISLTVKYRSASPKLDIACITTVSKYNYKNLKELVELTNSMGIDRHILRGMSEFTTAAINKSIIDGIAPEPYFMPTVDGSNYLNKAEANELLRIVAEIKAKQRQNGTVYVDITNLEGLSEDLLVDWRYPKSKCVFCTTQLALTPSADVLPCLYYNKYILGNLQKQEIADVWGNEKHRRFHDLQKIDKLELCKYCSIKFYHKAFKASLSEVTKKAKGKILG